MSSSLNRFTSLAALAFLAASCSQSDQGSSSDSTAEQAQDASAPPDIALSAAPGVAFRYDYRFRLPDARISAAQEAHAAACERLGLARCRITGMSYALDRDENVSAELQLKLDPAIARAFGKSASALVERNDGRLDSLEIGSSDEGANISGATRERAGIAERIARIEAELAKTTNGNARAALIQQLDALRAETSRQTTAISDSQAALATTPMKFTYYGEGGAPGFRGDPVREAWHLFIGTVVVLANFLLRALAVLVPLGVVFAMLALLWRSWPLRKARAWLWKDDSDGSSDAGDHAGHA